MRIKDWIHAIDLTIKTHKLVVDGKYEDYDSAKHSEASDDWYCACPLCQYVHQLNPNDPTSCDDCVWVRFVGKSCGRQNVYDVYNSEESIERLTKWKEILMEENKIEQEKHKFETPERVFGIYYKGRVNIVTPKVLETNWLDNGIVYEISTGSIDKKELYGVTVLGMIGNGIVGEVKGKNKVFESKEKAEEYIEELKGLEPVDITYLIGERKLL